MSNEHCPPCSGNCKQGRACPACDARARISREPEGDALAPARGFFLAMVIASVFWAVVAVILSQGAWV